MAEAPKPADATDRRLRALAYGVEFSKRCAESARLEELYLLLTNDIAAVVEFDRASLVVHLGEGTEFVAANNTPVLDKRARFFEEASRLGAALRGLERGVLMGANIDAEALQRNGVTPSQVAALRAYSEFAKFGHLFVLPLSYEGKPVAHLVLEMFAGRVPDETRFMALLNIAPLLASMLVQKWLVAQRPALAKLIRSGGPSGLKKAVRRLVVLAAVLAAVWAGLFHVPVPVQVGGEAEVGPRVRNLAFCQLTGLIAKVAVKEGASVKAGQVLATLDSRELEFRIKSAERQIELLAREMDYLQRLAAHGQVAKLAERQLVELKQEAARLDLAHLKSEQQYLEIKAPVSGVVVTRDVDALVGKKLQAGEPFCEVLAEGALIAEVMVPEDRIGLVKVGQELALYLDTDPRTALPLAVEEIAPKAEVIPRLGSVFRVRAAFRSAIPVMAGMKGIGKIQVASSPVWNVLRERASRLWRRFSLHF